LAFCVGNLLGFRDQNRVFESIGADQFFWPANLTGGDGAQPLMGQRVTQGVLPTLGIQPALGRWFLEDDYQETAPPAVIISHRLWQRRFGSDLHIVGKKLSLDSTPHTIVGVMPASFRPPAWFYFNDEVDFWRAFRFLPEQVASASRYLGVIARLRPGASLEQARADIETVDAQLARAFPERNKGWTVLVRPMREVVTRGMREDYLLKESGAGSFALLRPARPARCGEYMTEQKLVSIRRLAGNQNGTVEQTLMGVFEVLCGDSLAVSSQINIAELLVVARSQEESIVSRFEADVLSVIARYPDAGRHGRSMGAAWNRRAGTGDASSRHFGWREVGGRKPV